MHETHSPRATTAGPHRRLAALAMALAALLVAGCTTASSRATLVQADARAERPPLLPLRRFVLDPALSAEYQLSPDGSRLLGAETVGADTGLVVRDAATRAVLARYPAGRGLRSWLADSRHIVQWVDPDGDENTRIFVRDTREPKQPAWQVTPWPGSRSMVVSVASDGAVLRFTSNRRTRAAYDLFEADANRRSVRELARNDGTIRTWLFDEAGGLAGRIRALGPEATADRVVEFARPDGTWVPLQTFGAFDTWNMLRIDARAERVWARTNVGRDLDELVEIDVASGVETVLATHPRVDFNGPVFLGRTGPPVGVVIEPDLPQLRAFDPALVETLRAAEARALRDGLVPERPVLVLPHSVSDDRRRWILRAIGRLDIAELLWEPESGRLERLDTRRSVEAVQWLSPHEPFSFAASDGRRIHGLLTRPRGLSGPVPMVVEIHGGPWYRDYWQPAAFNPRQMLANRGYAVLQVNYRGSAGYGRDHLWSGARQAGDRVQRDIAEAVRWAIDNGIADPDRIGLLGGSFGGYSVMMQLIAQPHPYRCGVSIAGVANWVRVIEKFPPFWGNSHYYERFYGRVSDPAEREAIWRASPLAALDRITAPLLVIHGSNDVVVSIQDSHDVVTGLRALGRPVGFLSFQGEGHGITKAPNRLAVWREIEDRFADCLGGRNGGPELPEPVPASPSD